MVVILLWSFAANTPAALAPGSPSVWFLPFLLRVLPSFLLQAFLLVSWSQPSNGRLLRARLPYAREWDPGEEDVGSCSWAPWPGKGPARQLTRGCSASLGVRAAVPDSGPSPSLPYLALVPHEEIELEDSASAQFFLSSAFFCPVETQISTVSQVGSFSPPVSMGLSPEVSIHLDPLCGLHSFLRSLESRSVLIYLPTASHVRM